MRISKLFSSIHKPNAQTSTHHRRPSPKFVRNHRLWLDSDFISSLGLVEKNPGPELPEISDLDDISRIPGTRILYLNIRHLNNKVKHLETFLTEVGGPAICCIAESWLQDDMDSRLLNIKGHKMFRFDRNKANRTKGIVVYIHNSIHHTQPKCFKELDFTLTYLTVTAQRKSYRLAFVYRPESGATMIRQMRFINKLSQHLTSLQSNDPLILIGDVNMDLARTPMPPDSRRLSEAISELSLDQQLTSPTRVTSNSSTLIDWVCFNQADISHDASLLNFESHVNTDHNCVGVLLKKPPGRDSLHRHTYSIVPDFNRYNSETARRLLSQENWQDVYVSNDLDEKYRLFEEKITAFLTYASPVVKRRTCDCVDISAALNSKQPWYTRDLSNLKKSCSELYKTWKRHPRGSNHSIASERLYREAIKSYQKAHKTAHTDYNLNILERARERGNSQLKHKHLKLLRGVSQTTNIDKISYGGHTFTSKIGIANALNNYFIGVGREAAASAIHILTPELTSIFNADAPNFYFRPPGFCETYKRLRAIKLSKPPGPGMIPGKFYREFTDELVFVLEHIFAHCVYRSSIPSRWKETFITPIYKNKGEAFDPQNYRPIGITSVIGKVFEGFLCDSLVDHLERNNLLSSTQYGYRSKRSTSHAITHLVEAIRGRLNEPGGPLVGVLLLDLSKAFDCISHNLLLQMLPRYGLDDPSTRLISSFLSGRKQRVKLSQDVLSDEATSVCGVPQGSLLGPILFDVYVNALSMQTPASTPQYADDTAVIRSSESIDNLKDLLTSDLNSLTDYFRKLGLLLNVSKTDYLLFGFNGPGDSSILFNQTLIRPSQEATYLGVRIDNRLSFNGQNKAILNKLKFATRTIRKLRPHITQNIAIELLHSLFYSHSDYCSLIWGQPENTAASNKLEVQHRCALKAVYQRPRRTHSVELYRSTKSLTLAVRRTIVSLMFVFRILHGLAPDNWTDLFERSALARGVTVNRLVVPHRRNFRGTPSLKLKLPALWNSLPADLRSVTSITIFKARLTQHFKSVFRD
jgi:hypothetical protein